MWFSFTGDNDYLDGGNGNDVLWGGGGNNIFVLNLDYTGTDTFRNFYLGQNKIQITQEDYDQINIVGNTIYNSKTNEAVVRLKYFTGELTIDDFIIIPKLKHHDPRASKMVDDIKFEFDKDDLDITKFEVVGVFEEDHAQAEKLEVVQIGVDNGKDIYKLQVKEGEAFYDTDTDYLKIEYDGEYVGGGAIVVDIY